MATLDRMKQSVAKVFVAGALALGGGACGDSGGNADSATSADVADTSTATDTSVVEEVADTTTVEETAADTTTPAEVVVPTECAHEPACSDQQIAALPLRSTVSGGAIEELDAPDGQFLTHIDASAGGFSGTKGYTYARFTSDGMVAVAISDEDSLDDATWDIAFRRFVVRLNSGVSGPACVLGAQLQKGTEFGGVKSEPAGLDYQAEAYFEGAACDFVDDGSGIGGPGTVLSTFWDYVSCVAMNGSVYVLRLSDGHHVKLQVEDYYDPAAQDECDNNGAVGNTSSAGNFRVRWAYLD